MVNLLHFELQHLVGEHCHVVIAFVSIHEVALEERGVVVALVTHQLVVEFEPRLDELRVNRMQRPNHLVQDSHAVSIDWVNLHINFC